MGLITATLRPAVGLWLRSQLEAVETLHLDITGRDRELLQGYIRQVALQATTAVYEGLHLSRVDLAAESIALQWRPAVELRAPLLADLQVILTQANLTASLKSPLLQSGIADLLARAFGTNPLDGKDISWETACLEAGAISLRGHNAHLQIGITARDGALQVAPLCLQLGGRHWQVPFVALELGDAAISRLEIEGGCCKLAGKLAVRPQRPTIVRKQKCDLQ